MDETLKSRKSKVAKDTVIAEWSNKNTLKSAANSPRMWNQLAYAGKDRVPTGIAPLCGSWPLFYLQRDGSGNFINPLTKEPIAFEIRHPNSIRFAEELEVVKETLSKLTPEQKAIAEYWGEGPATKQWTPIIDKLIDTYAQPDYPQENPVQAARIIAAVQAGINDAFIVTWHFKYLWLIPRPNQLDQELTTYLCTPMFPAYPSGHSVMSGCAQMILSHFFPPEAERLEQLAEECAISRLYGGVHFPSDAEQGLRLGRQIGRIIVSVLSGQRDSDQAVIDPLITKDLHANLLPPPYKQAIPFPRPKICDTPILSAGSGSCSKSCNKTGDDSNFSITID